MWAADVQLIFLRDLCGYVWVNILLPPRMLLIYEMQNKENHKLTKLVILKS